MQDKELKSPRRRDFLKLAGLGAGVAAACGLTPTGVAQAAEKPQVQSSAGYRESEHVRKYYALARF